MPKYRRFKLPGACYFFTVVSYNREAIFSSEYAASCLREAFCVIQKSHPFKVEGIVVLPNHIHAIWSLPENDSNYSLRWNLLKNRFTKLYLQKYHPISSLSQSRVEKREQGVWQRRFWEHFIRNEVDFIRHLEYIHYNPVKHGYVQNPIDWQWTSFHRYVKLGWYEKEWGSTEVLDLLENCIGE